MKLLTRQLVAAATAVLATATGASAVELTDEQVEDLVKRSYQYVAMYNVINKGAMLCNSPCPRRSRALAN